VFGAVAVVLQLLAARAMRRSGRSATLDHLTVYVGGVFLRLLGVIALGIAIATDRTTFHPWASSIGYLGTVLPLLYLETRLGA
jgi:succinate dehydrogenase hydrophobic anchor subunit